MFKLESTFKGLISKSDNLHMKIVFLLMLLTIANLSAQEDHYLKTHLKNLQMYDRDSDKPLRTVKSEDGRILSVELGWEDPTVKFNYDGPNIVSVDLSIVPNAPGIKNIGKGEGLEAILKVVLPAVDRGLIECSEFLASRK